MEELQLIAEGRRNAISGKTISTMLDAGNSIPEIKKTVGGREALTIMSYMDLYNWRQEVEKTRGNFSESRSDAVELLGRMESKGYLASAMIGEDNRLDCIFFMHPKSLEEVKWRGQVLNVDAMYKVNNLDMSLISVQSVSNLGGVQLSTVPIAYGIARRETTEVYTWFLQMLKDRAYNQLCKAPVIVTDKSAALMAAIRSVFPASLSIICTWHIFENFKKSLSDVFKDKNDKELCMNLVQDMINSRTEDQYQRSYKKYQVIASNKSLLKDPESLKALNYFDLNWEPIKHMWAGYRTKELCHFDCTTTQRVEGSHAVLKRSVALSSRTNLADMFDIIDKHIKEFYIKANQSVVKEGRVVDALVRSASYMQNLIGKVSAWALVNIHTNALKAFELEESKVERCHCVDPIWFLIPCQHQLFEYVCGSQNTKIPLCAINRRWHLHPEEESAEAAAADTTSDSTADVNVLLEITLLERSDSMQRLLNKIELAFRNCTNLNETYHLEDCINEGLALHEQFLDSKKQPSQLPLPGTVPKLGRPAKEKAYSAWRDVKPSNKVEPVKAESLKLPKKRKAGWLSCILTDEHHPNLNLFS